MDLDPWQYIVLVGAIILVSAFIMPRNKKDTASESPSSVQNMEAALEQFMDNMDQENQELVQLVANAQQAAKQDAEQKEQRITALELRSERLSQQLQALLERTVNASPPMPPAAQSAAEGRELQSADETDSKLDTDQSIHYRYSELFQLYENGKSTEAIAKKLGMNKGEVQLIIQLAKQEETIRV